jgi:hypothetical protein
METAHKEQEDGRRFGDRDAMVPYMIGGAVFGILTIALLTVGDSAMPMSTALAFAGVMVWFVIGVYLTLVSPIVVWVLVAKNPWGRMVFRILTGIVYFVISGVLMANFSLPIS